MSNDLELIKKLREETAAGVMDCKKALAECGNDLNKAAAMLKEKGLAKAAKRAERAASQGLVEAYIHGGGRIGVLVEINCETDFVARTDDFKALAHDLAMQVAAANPTYLSKEDIPAGVEDNPAEVCLLEQPFIKNPSETVRDLVNAVLAKTGEKIVVNRFVRFELGGQ